MVAPNDVVIIDLSFLLESSERSFYGAPLILGTQGEDNTVLYGVARDLLRLRKGVGIGRAIVVIGREAHIVSNEANVASAVRLLRRLGVAVVCEPKTTAGSLCRSLSSAARWVVTQNRVLFQLVNDDFGIILPGVTSDELQVVTTESLKATLGIRPSQVLSFLALSEGGKRALFTKRQAIRLLEVHDNLEKLLQDLSGLSSHSTRRQLSANKEVLLGRLYDMRFEETVSPAAALAGSDLAFIEGEDSAGILREYGFWSLVRLLPRSARRGAPASPRVTRDLAYKAIRNDAGMREFEARVSHSEVCAIDTEATDKDPRSGSLVGVAFSVKAEEAFYVPLVEDDLELPTDVVKARLQKVLAGRTRFVGHNVKFDCVLLRRNGITIKHVFFDTMLAAYECFGDWEFFNLGALAKRLLGKEIKRYRDIVGEGETLLDVPFKELLEHACSDADITLRLYGRLKQELESRKLLEQFSAETMGLLRTLVDKECNGVRLNIKAVHRRKEVLAKEVDALRKAAVAQAGTEFDLDSPMETASVLRSISPFGEQIGRRVTLAQLEQLAGMDNVPRVIVKYRRARKRARELDAICAAVKDGRVFPIFSQVRWAHGSLSSTYPRICDPGGPLDPAMVIDRTIREQMGDPNRALDILQRVTRDSVFGKDWREGGDHPSVIGKGHAEQDLDQKDLVLSVAIGASDSALSSRFLIDRLTVAGIRQALEAKYAKLFKWLDIYRRDTLTQGFAQHNGSRKYLEGLRSSDLDKRHKAVRSAVRWLIRY
jgi:hypothetical protein